MSQKSTTRTVPLPASYGDNLEVKVKAATAGGGDGGILAGLLVWALGRYVFRDQAVPEIVVLAVSVAAPAAAGALGALWAGWRARHTIRLDLGERQR